MDYKEVFRELMNDYVRKSNRHNFLIELLDVMNQNTSSPVWGAVWELLKEEFDYTDDDLGYLLGEKQWKEK